MIWTVRDSAQLWIGPVRLFAQALSIRPDDSLDIFVNALKISVFAKNAGNLLIRFASCGIVALPALNSLWRTEMPVNWMYLGGYQ
ncbi:MAG: hypothetical protein N4A61_07960 [Pelagimonas sp.]|nr:hypothetical protein [Pelagimonas sp.]